MVVLVSGADPETRFEHRWFIEVIPKITSRGAGK